MFARACLSIKLWDVPSLNDVTLFALNTWTSNTDSDISVFKIHACSKNTISDHVALRLLVSNFSKFRDGIDLIVVDENFVRGLDLKVDSDKKEIFGCTHMNIKSVRYSHFSKIIEYTYEKKNAICYTALDLKNLIASLSDSEYTALINDCKDENTKASTIDNKIKTHYFKGTTVFPKLL